MSDVRCVDHPGLRQVPSNARAVEQRLPIAEDDRDDMQLHLIDQALGQALAGKVGASADRGVAVTGCFSGELDCGPHTVCYEDEFDRAAGRRPRWSVGHHEMGHPVWRVFPTACVVPRTEGAAADDDRPRWC
jgi:hypothetical protein